MAVEATLIDTIAINGTIDVTELDIDIIRLDGGTQSRAELNEEHLEELSQLLLDGKTFKDPITTFFDGINYWNADGFHRIFATRRAGIKTIAAEIRQGTQEDAIEYSCGANATHGLRRKRGDVERAIKCLRSLPRWKDRTHQEIADHVHVSRGRVSQVLNESDVKINRNGANQPVEPVQEVEEPRLKRTSNEEKRQTVETYIASTPDWEQLSNKEIARRCGVSDSLVRTIRKELFPEAEPANVKKSKSKKSKSEIVTQVTGGEPEQSQTEATYSEPGPAPIVEVQSDPEMGTSGKSEVEQLSTPEVEAAQEQEQESVDESESETQQETQLEQPEAQEQQETISTADIGESEAIEDELPDEDEIELAPELVYEKDDFCQDFAPDPIPDNTQTYDEDTQSEKIEEPQEEPEKQEEPVKKESTKEASGPVAKSATLTALQSSESNEWYTPALYVNAARELMGGIDVDPASNELANKIVQATRYYDIERNGLEQKWIGRVWLNPPYGTTSSGESNQEVWSSNLLSQFETGVTTEAVLLVNANTEAKWFQPLYNYLICLTDHRIRFYSPDGDANQPTQGNALVYLGPQKKRFFDIFSAFGYVVQIADREAIK